MVKIGEMLKVNRNTINKNIREWYAKVSEELPEYNALLLLKQIYRLEMQQARLLEKLDECTDMKEEIAI